MTSPSARLSSPYKNLRIRNKQSPIEIKEKIRKSYKEKVLNCRNLLINSFRGVIDENNVRNTLHEIYKKTFNFTDEDHTLEDEKMLAEIQEELVKEELDWWLEEYEKYHTDNTDWNAIDAENVICPVCQKANFIPGARELSCSLCNITLKTDKSSSEVQNIIFSAIEKHAVNCSYEAQFSGLADASGCHIYLMCGQCNDMQIIV